MPSLSRVAAIVFMAPLVSLSSEDSGAEFRGVITRVLENGLVVLMDEDHSRPLVACCLMVNGGSRTEPPELAGLSHYYEHLIFRGGSRKQDETEFRRVIGEFGRDAGYTTTDYTCYGYTVDSGRFEEALWRSADAWLGLRLDEDKVLAVSSPGIGTHDVGGRRIR